MWVKSGLVFGGMWAAGFNGDVLGVGFVKWGWFLAFPLAWLLTEANAGFLGCGPEGAFARNDKSLVTELGTINL